MITILENELLKYKIFNFLKRKPEKTCASCNKILVWNNKIMIDYISVPLLDNCCYINRCSGCHHSYYNNKLMNC